MDYCEEKSQKQRRQRLRPLSTSPRAPVCIFISPARPRRRHCWRRSAPSRVALRLRDVQLARPPLLPEPELPCFRTASGSEQRTAPPRFDRSAGSGRWHPGSLGREDTVFRFTQPCKFRRVSAGLFSGEQCGGPAPPGRLRVGSSLSPALSGRNESSIRSPCCCPRGRGCCLAGCRVRGGGSRIGSPTRASAETGSCFLFARPTFGRLPGLHRAGRGPNQESGRSSRRDGPKPRRFGEGARGGPRSSRRVARRTRIIAAHGHRQRQRGRRAEIHRHEPKFATGCHRESLGRIQGRIGSAQRGARCDEGRRAPACHICTVGGFP